jgi:membrane-bound lytic murein transglycosylase A
MQKSRTARLSKSSFTEIINWERDKHAAAMDAFVKSCDKFLSQDPEKPVSSLTSMGGSVIDWQVPCMEATAQEKYTDAQAKAFFEKWFVPYKITDEDMNTKGTLTGYFEIELTGSKKQNGKYQYPIYLRPPELNDLKGSSEIQHASINDGVLSGRNLEVAWVDNRARLYFMHIQGSGVVKLKEGGEMRLGFDGHNGYRFQGISQALRDENAKLDSANSMMDWLHANPERCKRVIESDPSYVFFRKVDSKSAIGGQGVPLKTERSLAVDCGLYPYGMPIWVDADLPQTKAYNSGKYSRLFIAQDTGGAIRGPARGDIFFGRGKKAEVVAGGFKTKGSFFALFPKSVKVPEIYTAMN